MATSPTGTPIISPKLVPWIAIAMAVLSGVSATLTQTVGHPTEFTSIMNWAFPALSGLLGVISPGWRTPAPAGQTPPSA